MTKSIKKNYIYNIFYQLLAILIPIVVTPYLARVLTPDGVGISAYTISVVTYFILFGSMGISLYGQREIAYVQDDKKKRSIVFFELNLIKIIFSLITLIVYVLFIKSSPYYIYYRVLIFELLSNLFDISWFYQGIENFKITVIKNSIIKLLSLICIFLLIKSKSDVSLYLLIYSLSTLIGNFTLWININKYVDFSYIKVTNSFHHLKYILLFFIPQIANKLYAIIDKTMLGILIPNISETGFYSEAEKIVKIWITIITALGIVIMPRIANYYAKNDKNGISNLMKKSIRYVYFCSLPMTFGLISVASNIIPIYLGNGYDKSIVLIEVLSPIILIIGLNNIIGNQYLLPTNQQKKYTISVTVGCVINLVLNYFLINLYGSYGAAISTLISEFVVLSIELFFVRNQFNFKKVFLQFGNYLIASLVMFIFTMFLKNITNNVFMNSIIQVLCGFASYFIVLIILKDPIMKYILDYCKELVKKFFSKIN